MYKELILPVLGKIDSETAHDFARRTLHLTETTPGGLSVLERSVNHGKERFFDPKLNVYINGINFDNPVMVGAGWDKEGKCVKALFALGFSAVETGTFTPYPQDGNPKPRQFAIAPGVVINRCGFNNPGADQGGKNLEKYLGSGIPIGINLGINKDTLQSEIPQKYAEVAGKLERFASYLIINVSSPNTPNLRDFQNKEPLMEIVCAVKEKLESLESNKPVFIKIAPELNNQEILDIIDIVLEKRLAGIIACNTSTKPQLKGAYASKWVFEKGGLSGDDDDYRWMTTKKIAFIRKEAGDQLTIIGVGGVKDSKTALQKIRAGASLIQLVTAIRGEGLFVARNINRGLIKWMDENGVKSLSEIVGLDAQQI
jgi:dihydroorotate dehydrogenase